MDTTKSTLKQMTEMSKSLGVRYGENAAEFRKRDPQAARKLAEFITANKTALVKAISSAL